jgi:chromatin assembly factor 1 subunit A
MEAPLPIALASPQKRPHTDDVEPAISTPNRNIPSNASTPLTVISSLETPSPSKPMKRVEASPSDGANATSNGTLPSTQPASASGSTQQSAKRRKLTQQEKEEQAKEKEAKAQARAEKKVQEEKSKAEQKVQKEEEKRIKDEEKRKKNEEKEEKKRAKELKQQQEEDEKRKKERVSARADKVMLFPRMFTDRCVVPNETECFLHQAQGCCRAYEQYHGRVYPETPYCSNIYINRHRSRHR